MSLATESEFLRNNLPSDACIGFEETYRGAAQYNPCEDAPDSAFPCVMCDVIALAYRVGSSWTVYEGHAWYGEHSWSSLFVTIEISLNGKGISGRKLCERFFFLFFGF